MPEVGKVVLFSYEQQPRVGCVVELREHEPKPLIVHLWKPKRSARDFISAQFFPFYEDGEPAYLSLSSKRIKLANLEVDEKGYFKPDTRKKLASTLNAWK